MKIIKFETDNCSYCKSVGNYFRQKGVPYESINVMECDPGLCVQNKINSVPVTILLDDDGKEVMRSIGYKSDELNNIIKTYRGEC